MTIMSSLRIAGTAAATKVGAGPARPHRRPGTARSGRAGPIPSMVPATFLAMLLCVWLAGGSGSLSAPASSHVAGETIRLVSADRPAGTTASHASRLLRYVALGDSVPYGHGLANPSNKTQSGLPPNQGPSPLAWPSLVDKGLHGLAPLILRKKGCTLTGDQLAVSGAPAQANKWTGKEPECGLRVHAAVVPDEINAADLGADPPALVTIQAGADDINFAGCLTALLDVPGFLGGDQCVTHSKSGYHLTATAAAELTSAKAGLEQAIADVLAAAPNAQILLVDYYQIIPAVATHVQGTSTLCDLLDHPLMGRKDLRAAGEYLQARLNGAINAAAQGSPNVAVVDVKNEFSGHEMCTRQPWVYGGGITDGFWRVGHPTKQGQAVIAKAVVSFCQGPALKNHCLGHPATGPRWGAAITAPPAPGQSTTTPDVQFMSASCGSPSWCVAVGWYIDTSGYSQGLLLTGSGATWKAARAPLPATVTGDPGVNLESVSCTSATWCVAVGVYTDTAGAGQGLILTWNGKSWHPADAPLPRAPDPGYKAVDAQPYQVACSSPAECIAVGRYGEYSASQGEDGPPLGLMLTWSGKTWTATGQRTPGGSLGQGFGQGDSIACSSGGLCVAPASYQTPFTDQFQELLYTWSGTAWTAAAPMPASNSEPSGTASCPTRFSCVVAASYQDSASVYHIKVLTGAGSTWKPAQVLAPAGIDANGGEGASAVACPSATSCVIAGEVPTGGVPYQGVIITGSGTAWTAIAPPGTGDLFYAACPSTSSCVIAGQADPSNVQVVTGAGATWVHAGTAGGALDALACGSVSMCIAVGNGAGATGEDGFILKGPA